MYNTIWRWHFYAGLFCIPFVLVLAISGAIYLFKPQFEAAQNRPYNQLKITGHSQSAAAQVNAALAAVPGTVLNAYELPKTPYSAVQVLVGQKKDLTRVYVHPETLQILKIEREDDKLMRVVHELHGNFLIGDSGSYLVELAASWTIVMMITGLYLWWPSNMKGLAGILYPRLDKTGRLFWRDMHAVIGFWISFFTLFLLLSGLPWAKSWGGLLKEVRSISAGKVVQQDWTTGPASALAERQQMNMSVMSESEHSEHMKHLQGNHKPLPAIDYSAIDRLVATVQPLDLAYPVLISPPSKKSSNWMASSKAQNRPLRVDLVLDAKTGTIISRRNFADRPLFDRIIGYGIAIHEGQLFGWFNQLLGLLTALGLTLLSVSAVILWWRRRAPGVLGAPNRRESPSYAYALIGVIVALGILLPFLGITLMIVLCAERWILRHLSVTRHFLGLS
ncbi:MAG: PepSY-associated TM helix domain-containing protein [Methylophilus sp.]